MEIFCPFCLTETEHEGNKCKQRGENPIPQSYINRVSSGIPIYPVVVIGYTGCGKTTFLCSLVYKFLESDFFHIEPLDQSTINRIKNDYLPVIINKKTFLEPTSAARVFEDPLLLELELRASRKTWFGILGGKKIILLMYDVSGETYNTIDNIVKKFPFLANIPNLIILVDLYTRYKDYGGTLEFHLQSLISNVKRALEELGSPLRKKNAIICFTKMDECWKTSDFGPLSKRDDLPNNLQKYYKEMIRKSKEIEKFLQKERLYDDFYRSIVKDFGGWFFIDTSSVGGEVKDDNTFDIFSPYRVIDPILWLIK